MMTLRSVTVAFGEADGEAAKTDEEQNGEQLQHPGSSRPRGLVVRQSAESFSVVIQLG
jgi:hypothetical protein